MHYSGLINLWQEARSTYLKWCAGVDAGEFGTTLALADDLSWLRDLSSWINNMSPANDGQHSPVTSYFYW